MKTETALKWQTSLLQQVRDTFSLLETCKESHQWLTAKLNAIYKAANNAKVPQYIISYVKGYERCLHDLTWKKMEFCYDVNGFLYSTEKDSTHQTTEVFYAKGEGHILSKYEGAHYWRGTDKKY